MGWLILCAGAIFLINGTAIAYVIGASSILTYIINDQSRYLAIIPQRIFPRSMFSP